MQDGFVDRYFNRRVSSHLTRWFLKTSLTPNHITLISLGVGFVAGFFFWVGGYGNGMVGALLFQFSAILDCCDGEVARSKSMQSRLGWWLDLVGDNVVHVVLFLSIAWAAHRDTGSGVPLVLGIAASAGVLMSLGMVLLLERGSGKSGRSGLLNRAVDQLTNRDFSVMVLLFAVAGRIDWFLWLAAVGSNIFWMVLLGLYDKKVQSA